MKEVMSRIQLALVFMSGWLRYSLAEIVKVAQVFASKSGSNIDEQVAQIFIDIHSRSSFQNYCSLLSDVVMQSTILNSFYNRLLRKNGFFSDDFRPQLSFLLHQDLSFSVA